ncbi:nucleotidyltransferase domain-containing protein [Thermococcus sp. AM4]|uniref:nucleotidyltransferase domain-containing protein n=1 Tax=Thermococcus sp. (strain AM4) TaxID=246969 RepID=UPI0001870EA2|nr:nucleotidyltransferase domain-containing protein [Thermococcus sp. AM4]EEB73075.1 Nucleotidyltransferase domain protein [Thermococcus sp. AM4]
MADWKRALEKFIGEWSEKDSVGAAILTGSYALGLQTPRSDVDVYVILSDDVDWRERGNVFVDGFLIEYFANPIRQIRRYFEEEHSRNKRNTARIILIGKVLFDKTGIVESLRAEAEEYMRMPFPKPEPVKVELAKYVLWDALDSLKDAEERGDPSYAYLYHLALREALESYARFLRVEVPPASKVYRLFSDEAFREAYLFPNFPDDEFVALFLRAMKEVRTENVEALVTHVLERMGGFSIDGWRLRTGV